MPDFPNAIPPCPQCQGTLRFVRSDSSKDPDACMSGSRDDLELYMLLAHIAAKGDTLEMFTFECARCGPIYLSGPVPGQDIDDRDRDSLVGAPRRPAPQLDKTATAVPASDDDPPHS